MQKKESLMLSFFNLMVGIIGLPLAKLQLSLGERMQLAANLRAKLTRLACLVPRFKQILHKSIASNRVIIDFSQKKES